jgi:hypothetical protein
VGVKENPSFVPSLKRANEKGNLIYRSKVTTYKNVQTISSRKKKRRTNQSNKHNNTNIVLYYYLIKKIQHSISQTK